MTVEVFLLSRQLEPTLIAFDGSTLVDTSIIALFYFLATAKLGEADGPPLSFSLCFCGIYFASRTILIRWLSVFNNFSYWHIISFRILLLLSLL